MAPVGRALSYNGCKLQAGCRIFCSFLVFRIREPERIKFQEANQKITKLEHESLIKRLFQYTSGFYTYSLLW